MEQPAAVRELLEVGSEPGSLPAAYASCGRARGAAVRIKAWGTVQTLSNVGRRRVRPNQCRPG
jgi:hypothetical protein